ncbi:MAG: acyltransferase [Desulfocapsaceae bacterium]|nr:acyltransferase [Desulfocapsaceae bacterium]
MNKWFSIQALRGLAVLGVVLFHLMTIEKKYSGGDLFLPEFLTLGQSGVDLFFVISGFVMVSITQGRDNNSGGVSRFLWSRLSRIYPTYWVYLILTAAVFFIKPDWVNSSQNHQTTFFSAILLLPDYHRPFVMVAWSLIHELWFYTMFAIFLKFNPRYLLPSLVVWGLIITIASTVTSTANLSPGARIVLHPYSLEFIIGAFAAIFTTSKYFDTLSIRLSFISIVIIPMAGLPLIYAFNILKNEGLMRVSIIGTLYGLLLTCLTALEMKHKFCLPRFLQSIGDRSYTIYLSHILVLAAVGRLWSITKPIQNNLFDNMLACLIMSAAVLAYGWLGYRLVEHPLLRISHNLRSRWFE